MRWTVAPRSFPIKPIPGTGQSAFDALPKAAGYEDVRIHDRFEGIGESV